MFGKLLSYRMKKHYIELKYEEGLCLIEFINNDIIRFVSYLEKKEKSFAIDNLKYKNVNYQLSKVFDHLEVKTLKWTLKVYDDFKIDIYDQNNVLICEDYKKERNPFIRHALELNESEEETLSASNKSAEEGHKAVSSVNHHKLEVVKKHHSDDHYFGLGEKTGFLDKTGYEYEMWNTDEPSAHLEYFKTLYKSVPFYIVLNPRYNYGIFFDNTYRTFFDMGKENADYIYFGADFGNLDYYFIGGASLKEIISGYTSLTGTTPLPAKKTLGAHQSRWSYGSSKRVDQIIHSYIDNGIPLDYVHLDIDYMKDYKVFTFNDERFPNLKDKIKEWDKLGVGIISIIDPGVKVEDGYFMYEEGKKDNLFLTKDGEIYQNRVWPGLSVYPDFSKKETRTWWSNATKILTDKGIRGIWNDMNEPASFDGPLPDDVMFENDGNLANHLKMHNVYAHLMAKATYNGLKENTNIRPFVLTRAAYAGTQKYSTFWTGDNQSLWIHLQMAIPMLCNMGLSGFSLVGTDIGGFGGDVTKELLCRWVEAGSYFPLCRNHSSMLTRDQEPTAFDKETLEIYKKAIKNRYKLIPYYYDLFYQSEKDGLPVMRPLVLNYQNDQETYNLNDEFMIGDSILVSPVLESGKNKKMVYLPAGKWYMQNTSVIYKEGYHIVDAPLGVCPTFVKMGSIIPSYDNVSNLNKEINEIIFDIYPGKKEKYVHIYDDGKTFDYQRGVLTKYYLDLNSKELKIKVENNYQVYQNVKYRIYGNIKEVLLDNEPCEISKTNEYIQITTDGFSHTIKFE